MGDGEDGVVTLHRCGCRINPHHCDVREQGRVVRPRRKVGEDDGGEDARPPRCRIVAVIVLLCPRRG